MNTRLVFFNPLLTLYFNPAEEEIDSLPPPPLEDGEGGDKQPHLLQPRGPVQRKGAHPQDILVSSL